MHDIEPFYSWRSHYVASEDERSPFYLREYSEFEFTNAIYNHLIHPQWDSCGSETLYLKILFVDYDQRYCIIELFGEWNDCIYNDVMHLKRNVVEPLLENGINRFILIGENVLNFHSSDDCYYEEWFEEIEDGWIVAVNFRPHVIKEFEQAKIDRYIALGYPFDNVSWRPQGPSKLFKAIETVIWRRLGDGQV